ncbi:MAG: MFS transporter [Candidatus Brocadiia bacterium]
MPETTPGPTGFQKVLEFLGLKRTIIGLLGMVLLVGMGEKMAERFLPIYLVALAGAQGELLAGMLNALTNLLGALYSFPGGYLSDRLGTKKALLVFNLLAIFGFAIVIVFRSALAVFVGSFFFLSWTAISLPATMSLVAQALPRNKRTMGVTMHSLIRRIPMAIGPVLGGLFIWWGIHISNGDKDQGTIIGIQIAFVAAIVLAVLAIFLQQHLIKEDPAATEAHKKKAEPSPYRIFREMCPELKNLLFSDTLIRFCEQLPYAYLAIWAMDKVAHPVSAPEFGILTAIEMATAMLVYIPVAYFADKSGKKPFVAVTFLFFTIFPVALLYAQSFWPLAIAFFIRGLKELGEPTRKALIMDLAPEDRKAATFGTYYLVRDLVVSFAAVGGALLWYEVSPQIDLLAAFACGAIGTVIFIIWGKDTPAPSKAAST